MRNPRNRIWDVLYVRNEHETNDEIEEKNSSIRIEHVFGLDFGRFFVFNLIALAVVTCVKTPNSENCWATTTTAKKSKQRNNLHLLVKKTSFLVMTRIDRVACKPNEKSCCIDTHTQQCLTATNISISQLWHPMAINTDARTLASTSRKKGITRTWFSPGPTELLSYSHIYSWRSWKIFWQIWN